MSTTTSVSLVENTANPAPLGLCAFGMTTILLNIHNAGFFELNAMILGMGIFYGGSAQVIAGIMEFKKNNTFGFTAFISYGMFWLTFVAMQFLPKWGIAEKAVNDATIAFLALWGFFTLLLFIGTFRLSKALQVVFGTLVILFGLLVWSHVTGSETIEHIAGYEGIICGASALYTGVAQILNEVYGRVVLP
ncbi:MAG: hypothetical protein EOP47_25410, partial [Sphingobacteriaceae bacterium]